MQFVAATGEQIKLPCPEALTVQDCLRYFEEQGPVNSLEDMQLLSCPQRFDHLYIAEEKNGIRRFSSPDHHVKSIIFQSQADISNCVTQGSIRFTVSAGSDEQQFALGQENIMMGAELAFMPCFIRDIYYGDVNRDDFGDLIVITGDDGCNVPQLGTYYEHCSQLYVLFNSSQYASSEHLFSFNTAFDACAEDAGDDATEGSMGCSASGGLRHSGGNIGPVTRAANALVDGLIALYRMIF